MEIEANACGRVEQIGGQRVLDPVDERSFDPPLVPIILPAVKAVARDCFGQIYGKGPRHHCGE